MAWPAISRSFPWFLVLVISLSTASSALAQQGTGVIQGVVTDGVTRAPLEGVVVTVTSPVLQGGEIAATDASGFYRVSNLPPGIYSLRFDREGYLSSGRNDIAMRADITLRVNAAVLPEAAKAEELVLTQEAPTVDVGSSSTATSLSSEFTQRVPVSTPGSKGSATRSFESVAEVAPGAKPDTFGVSVAGTTSPENRYMLDGLSVSNPGFGLVGTALSTEFIKEVNVVTAGYMPEFGRATGGMITVVTESGSNQYKAGVWTFFSPGALEGDSTTVFPVGQTVLVEPQLGYIGDVGLELGGPILRDKLWFYTGFDIAQSNYQIDRSFARATGFDANQRITGVERIPGTGRRFTADMRTIQGMGKLTFAANANNRLTLAVYGSPTVSGGAGKYSLDPRTGQPEIRPDTEPGTYSATARRRVMTPVDALLKWNSEMAGKRLLLDVTTGVHREQIGTRAADGSIAGSATGLASQVNTVWRRFSPEQGKGRHSINDFEQLPDPTVCDPAMTDNAMMCPVTTYLTGGPGFLDEQLYHRYSGAAVLTWLLSAWGHHVLKLGFDSELTTYSHKKAYSGGRQFAENADGSGFDDQWGFGVLVGPDDPVWLNGARNETQSVLAGAFLQDSWSVFDKVTVNLGIRYDSQYLWGADGKLGLLLPNQWSPRAGVIYDFTQSGRSKVFVNYARYYQVVPLDLADVALSGEPHALASRPSSKCDPRNPAMQQTDCIDQSNLKPSGDSANPNRFYSSFGAGATPIDPDIKPPSADEIVTGVEYELFPDNRVGLTYSRRWVNQWVEDMSRDNAQSFFLGNPGYGIASDFPKVDRRYDAGTLFFTKAFSRNWLAQLSYTLSYLRGNHSGFFAPETGDLLPGHEANFDIKNLTVNRNGPLAGDRRHNFKAYAAKDWNLSPSHRIGSGLAAYAYSGEPTNYLGSHPLYGGGQTYILPRGSGERLPWNYGLDVQLAYRFAWSRGVTMAVTADVFNVINFQNVTARDQNYTDLNVYPIENGTKNDLANLVNADTGATVVGNDNHLRPVAYQPPRVFRFGLRAEF